MGALSNIAAYFSILPKLKVRLNAINSALNDLFKSIADNKEWGSVFTSNSEKNRLQQYVQVHSLMNFFLCDLANREMTQEELNATVYLCVCGPLFDDFFDEENINSASIATLLNAPSTLKVKSPNAQLFVYLWNETQLLVQDPDGLRLAATELFKAQAKSKKLKSGSLNKLQLKDIADDKGGVSALLFRSILSHECTAGEKEAVYALGALGQLMDDIFDFWEDHSTGIQTLVVDAIPDFKPIAQYFAFKNDQFKTHVKRLKYKEFNKQLFLREMHLMSAGGELCCDQFLKAQKINGGRFIPTEIGRQPLICDMESTRNRVKMLFSALVNA